MTHAEFCELTKKSNPVKVIYHDFGAVDIVFENEIEVSITIESDYDDHTLSFESNIEREQERLKREQYENETNSKKKAFEEAKQILKSTLTPAQWKILEPCLAFRNGTPNTLFNELLNLTPPYLKQMQDKYNTDLPLFPEMTTSEEK
jgi:hypothetical protein